MRLNGNFNTRGHCQSKFYTWSLLARAAETAIDFAHQSLAEHVRFRTPKRLYSFALTVPSLVTA